MGTVETIYEYLDDGYLTLWDGVSGLVTDYYFVGSVYVIAAGGLKANNPYLPDLTMDYAYKRFPLSSIADMDIKSATLYWYLYDVPYSSASIGCRLEAIEDYETLDIGDDTPVVHHDYGEQMAHNEAHPAWKSLDVTAVIVAQQADDFIGFRWRLMSDPAVDKRQYFYIDAYEESAYRAYLEIEYVVGQLNIGDVWKDIDSIQINIGDVWKDVTEVKINISGIWRKLFG